MKEAVVIIVSCVGLYFKDEIMTIVKFSADALLGLIVNRATFNIEMSPKLVFAVRERLGVRGQHINVRDGVQGVDFE